MNDHISRLSGVLKRYYWDRLRDGNSDAIPLKPFFDLVDCVAMAWKARLDRREECAYAGERLLQSVLDGTERRFTKDVQEANDLFTTGMRVAGQLWDILDDSGGDGSAFRARIHEMGESLSKACNTVV